MSEFKNTVLEDFKNVWVFCEQRQGVLMPTDFELISEGRKLADELGVKLCGLLLGDKVEHLAKELAGYGADEIIVCEHPLLKDYTTDAYTKVICDTVVELKPEALLVGATNIGRDLAPRCAARLHTGLCADCTHLDIDVPNYIQFLRESSTLDVDNMKWDMEDRNLKMTRPAFGGHLMATIICPRFRPQMSTVRPGVMKRAEFDEAKASASVIELEDVQLAPSSRKKIRVAITQGDANGVGYELILKTFAEPTIFDLCIPVVYGSAKLATYHRKAIESTTNFNLIEWISLLKQFAGVVQW